MNKKEMHCGIENDKQKEYEQYILNNYGNSAKKLIAESKENIKDWTQEDMNKHRAELSAIHTQLAQAIKDNLQVDSAQVQELIAQHYQWVSAFYQPTKEVYKGLGDLYTTHPDFESMYATFHPQLAHFLASAMKVYADKML